METYREFSLNLFDLKTNPSIEVRGEDVPLWVEELTKKGKRVIGLTGQDLFKEYCLKNYRTDLKILKIIGWDDPSALFRKPVLCLLGPKEKTLETIPRNQRVCISAKYKFLAKKYLNLLEARGYCFEKFYVNGSTEDSYSLGLADLVIDIVYTGNSIQKLGLRVYDKIFYSNFVVIGGKANDKC